MRGTVNRDRVQALLSGATQIGGYGKAGLRIRALNEPGSRSSIPNNLGPELDSKTYYDAICKKF
jgi:hypothetical protein